MKIHRNIDQYSSDWYRLRMGIPTASQFHRIMTPKERKFSASWKKYACELIAERLTNQPNESVFQSDKMREGKEREPDAVRQFEAVTDIVTQPVAFVTNDDATIGASPDRVMFASDNMTPRKVVEIKIPSLPIHLYRYLFEIEDAYACQVQGQMMICEVDEAIYYSWHERGPSHMVRTPRDDAFIGKLSGCLDEFNDKLNEKYEASKRWGVWQAFERVLTPVEIESATNLIAPSGSDVEAAIGANYQWGG